MLSPETYMADWGDFPYRNFIEWLDAVESKHGKKPALLFRKNTSSNFNVWTYEEFASECRRVARGLLAAGLGKGDRVALWAENRPEWAAVWVGTVIAGCTIVPVDFLISENECENIIAFTKAKAAFFSSQKTAFSDSLFNLSHLSVKIIISGEEYARFGANAQKQKLPGVNEIAESDVCSIVFTSGTTGLSKGVMLTHKGIIANVSAAVLMLRPVPEDVFINVLPLHHTYPTTCSFISPLSVGVPVIIIERLVGQIVIDDIRDGKGTFLIAVPLLYEKVRDAIDAKYRRIPFIVRYPVNLIRFIALLLAKSGRPEFGRAALRFIRKKAGLDTIRIMVAGGGALNPKTADFFDSFGFNIVHGYGMSENGPLISVNTTRFKNNVSVGLPVKYTEVRIVSADDDSARLKPGEPGEILVRSPSLMRGYYNNPETTAKMFSEDGFLKTGDLGYIDNKGFLFISGRKKNLIVSSGGKNIYPEEIEAHFNGSRIVDEILVVGRKSASGEHIFAAVYPNYDTLLEDYGDNARDEKYIAGLVRREIEKVNRSLPVYKKISAWTLRTEKFEKNAQKKIKRHLYKDYENPEKAPIS